MNIAEILKDAPKGTKLYSPLLGVVTLKGVYEGACYEIEVVDRKGEKHLFTSDGRFYDNYKDAECLLFPSKENRDWSTFKVEPEFPQFPITPEACVLIMIPEELEASPRRQARKRLLSNFEKLLTCRDAWWKVDNNWRPDWADSEYWVIENDYEYIRVDACANTNFVLAFRTEEIAEKFLETFRSLIEKCKELL